MSHEFKNPTFKAPDLTTSTSVFRRVEVGQADITDWKVSRGPVEVVRLPAGSHPDGATQALRLKSRTDEQDDAGSVSQEIATTAGAKTVVSWLELADTVGADQHTNEQTYRVTVTPVRDPPKKPVEFIPDSEKAPGWQKRSVEFQADAATATVEFRAMIQGTRSPLITGFGLTDGDGQQDKRVDLAASATSPVMAKPGQIVDLPFTVVNNGNATADGAAVTVRLTPTKPLEVPQGAADSVTLSGAKITPGHPVSGGFRVNVPASAHEGDTLTAEAVFTYEGKPFGTVTWQVKVGKDVQPIHKVDIDRLIIFQVSKDTSELHNQHLAGAPEKSITSAMANAPVWPGTVPGEESLICVGISSLTDETDLVGTPQVVKAPEGYVFTDVAEFGYFQQVTGWDQVTSKCKLNVEFPGGDRTRLRITGSETGHIRVPALLKENYLFLGYGLHVRCKDDAKPGPCPLGELTIGTATMPLSGTVNDK